MLNAGLSRNMKKNWAAVLMASVFIALNPIHAAKWFPVGRRTGGAVSGMLQMFNDKPVTLRTLDVGAISSCLTCRSAKRIHAWVGVGSHYARSAGDLLDPGAGDAASNAATGNLNILLPMVTSLDELMKHAA